MRYQTKEEQIADFLREEIVSGGIPRGTRLKQHDVAERLNTSITPVREALKLLKAEGYVIGDSYRGVTVTPFDSDASAEIRDLRITLEGKLVHDATSKTSSSDIDELRSIEEEFQDAAKNNDSKLTRGINYRFHRRIYEIAELPQTLYFVQILWARYPFDLINRIEGRAMTAIGEHDELLRFLTEGDAAGAVLATRRHIEGGWRALQGLIDDSGPRDDGEPRP